MTTQHCVKVNVSGCTFMFDPRTTHEIEDYRAKNNVPNRKPYRTAEQKVTARTMAKKVKGRYVSSSPRTLHPEARPR